MDSPRGQYQRFAKTAAGSARLPCKICQKVFTLSLPDPDQSPIRRQKVHGFKNLDIFRDLANKVAMNRICEMKEIGYKTLVDHIRFIHRQCQAFAASRECRLPEMDLGERFISVDRQDYTINWLRTKDKRNVILHGIGFFMLVRRRVMPLERTISTASSTDRVWHAYAPCRPELAVWLLEIYRTG